jgi:hypothetical protein
MSELFFMKIFYSGYLDLHPHDQKTRFLKFSIRSIILASGKKRRNLDAEYHQPGDATTLKSILNKYGKGGEVLGLVEGHSGEASSDFYRVADLIATRLASKHLDYVRTSASIAKAMQT